MPLMLSSFATVARNAEVTVVAGNGTEELSVFYLVPRLAALGNRLGHQTGNGVEHHIQAGAAAHHHILIVNAENIAEQPAAFLNSLQNAVVAAIHLIRTDKIGLAVDDVEHVERKVQLRLAGLAARHVEAQTLALFILILLLQALKFLFKLLLTALQIIHFDFSLSVYCRFFAFYFSYCNLSAPEMQVFFTIPANSVF